MVFLPDVLPPWNNFGHPSLYPFLRLLGDISLAPLPSYSLYAYCTMRHHWCSDVMTTVPASVAAAWLVLWIVICTPNVALTNIYGIHCDRRSVLACRWMANPCYRICGSGHSSILFRHSFLSSQVCVCSRLLTICASLKLYPFLGGRTRCLEPVHARSS